MLVPEMTGTYNFLARNEDRILGMVAALNLDMVGEKQSLTGGPLIVERTPEATSSYVNALMEGAPSQSSRRLNTTQVVSTGFVLLS
ncbi:hypothetical protein DRO27_01470 [Candidatus Bathyarchaeota archaeon]|nr:MAG: hypothetical protein DRO27_01470 [Candidatus Bathyarchaeota archaeon]